MWRESTKKSKVQARVHTNVSREVLGIVWHCGKYNYQLFLCTQKHLGILCHCVVIVFQLNQFQCNYQELLSPDFHRKGRHFLQQFRSHQYKPNITVAKINHMWCNISTQLQYQTNYCVILVWTLYPNLKENLGRAGAIDC